MKLFKKVVGIASAVAMLCGTSLAQAQSYDDCYDTVTPPDCAVAYYDSYGTQALSPCIGLGVVALAAIIAIAVNNSDRGHGHVHG